MRKKTEPGYDPIALGKAIERVVVDGNKRKYARLARPLRFYGGISSAVEVGCSLSCTFCFSDKPVRKPGRTGRFYTPQQVFDALAASARRHGHKLISASASESTLGRQHLFELLELVDQSPYVFILETNGMALSDEKFAQQLARFRNCHVRVSIKGTNPDEYHTLTGARASSYELPFRALRNLIDAGVSVNACVMISFSDDEGIREVKRQLAVIHPGLLKSLELEVITIFPKVAARLKKAGLTPTRIRHRGKIINVDSRSDSPGTKGTSQRTNTPMRNQ